MLKASSKMTYERLYVRVDCAVSLPFIATVFGLKDEAVRLTTARKLQKGESDSICVHANDIGSYERDD